MKEVLEFLTGNPNMFLATVEGTLPKVRPFQFMFGEGDKFYFCTSNKKDVYKQLCSNPNIEVSSMSAKFEWLRINGKVKFLDDLNIKNKIIEISPLVKSIYKSGDNPEFEIFYLENWEAIIADFSGDAPRKYKA